jgi:ADP-ribose diphosphatase
VPQIAPIADASTEVEVAGPDVLADGFRPYQRFRFALGGGERRTADILRAGPAVAVLPVDLERGEVVLIRQFRLAAHLANGRGELLEIVAGHVEKDERPAETARRECIEEIGVEPSSLVELLGYLTTPGMCDELITLFLAVVDASRVPPAAGLASEHEQTQPMRVPIDDALTALDRGDVHNGPLVVALQWLALNRHRLAEIARARGERS